MKVQFIRVHCIRDKSVYPVQHTVLHGNLHQQTIRMQIRHRAPFPIPYMNGKTDIQRVFPAFLLQIGRFLADIQSIYIIFI